MRRLEVKSGRTVFLLFFALLVACVHPNVIDEETAVQVTAVPTKVEPTAVETFEPQTEIAPQPTVPSASTNNRVEVEDGINFPRLLPRDGILPVYNPEFETAENVNIQEDELIIGISLGGEAKAYPITVLRFREMVDDQLAGIPILVTW